MGKSIQKKEVLEAQLQWARAIVKIGQAYKENKDFVAVTKDIVSNLYGYDIEKVLFKPTKASEQQFRLTFEGAVSYFIGNNPDFPEDNGFALQPWKKVQFKNAGFILEDNNAFAMGNYIFTDYTNVEIKVEYTFGYRKIESGALKIILHHSSLPFQSS